MRVIAGIAKGRRLESPEGDDVRPTRDAVKESIFNILAPRLASARVLELFAGSGALGIEALSRGAQSCVFVEHSPRAIALVRRNLERTGLQGQARVVPGRLPESLSVLSEEFDIIIADPPYEFDSYKELAGKIGETGLLAAGGVLVIEHGRPLPDTLEPFTRIMARQYGETYVSLFV